eukprot:CAMPEP_0114145544 /NCGR_PEP_ID=MMETSP0043_2-20121206/20103_1 /TAXON_ID=464988 /ORGANISM="Hemiselmis andersenii, Strain CCMP644" /LENGTH=178 /DNA_ID=CAMNT_0001239969 /DNA_START=429 /DNA_END=965 /DNA_ORIENTATION=-
MINAIALERVCDDLLTHCAASWASLSLCLAADWSAKVVSRSRGPASIFSRRATAVCVVFVEASQTLNRAATVDNSAAWSDESLRYEDALTSAFSSFASHLVTLIRSSFPSCSACSILSAPPVARTNSSTFACFSRRNRSQTSNRRWEFSPSRATSAVCDSHVLRFRAVASARSALRLL